MGEFHSYSEINQRIRAKLDFPFRMRKFKMPKHFALRKTPDTDVRSIWEKENSKVSAMYFVLCILVPSIARFSSLGAVIFH